MITQRNIVLERLVDNKIVYQSFNNFVFHMNRIDRLSAILIMLQSSTSVKPKQITDRFTIGLRTVYRDIKALEEAGIPNAGDSRIGYSLVDGFNIHYLPLPTRNINQ